MRWLGLICIFFSGMAFGQPFANLEQTLVHIDMKGSAPRPGYLKQLLTIFEQLGATGIVLEWEDMFPYTGSLSNYINGYAYSLAEVDDVLSHAQQLGLQVVPLVQTLGHAEWILKAEENVQIREDPQFPMVFCIGDSRARQLIKDSVQQVAKIHAKYGMRFFHIGADEAYQMGECPQDVALLNTSRYRNDTKRLVFDHMKTVAEIVTTVHPSVKVLAWFDEFKTADPSMLKEFGLDGLIEPVVWKYTDNLDYYLPAGMWRNLSTVFPNVWGASAYKGANGADKMDNAMKPYLKNNQEWFVQTMKHSEQFSTFRGMILTGWSRYDHFAVLCETMPTSMMSLAVNLQIITNYVVTERAAMHIMKTLKCPQGTTLDDVTKNQDKCHYPGYRVREEIRAFERLVVYYENATWIQNRERGWLRMAQQVTGHSNPYYVDVLATTYSKILASLDTLLANLKKAMDEIYYEETALEFRITYIDKFYEDISRKLDAIKKVDSQKGWPVRPILGRIIVEAPPVPRRTTMKVPSIPSTTITPRPTTARRRDTPRPSTTQRPRPKATRKPTTPRPKPKPTTVHPKSLTKPTKPVDFPTPGPLDELSEEEKKILRAIQPQELRKV